MGTRMAIPSFSAVELDAVIRLGLLGLIEIPAS
jgi:hypothetical protein